MSAVLRKTNQHPGAAVAVLLAVVCVLAGCASGQLKPPFSENERRALQAAIRKDGIAVVADGCVRIRGFYGTSLPVGKEESVLIGGVAAARTLKTLRAHGYEPKKVVLPFICGRAAGDPYGREKVVDRRGETAGGKRQMPVKIPGFEAEEQAAYDALFSALSPVTGWSVTVATDKARKPLQAKPLLDEAVRRGLREQTKARFVLVPAAKSSAETKAWTVYGWVMVVMGGAAGAFTPGGISVSHGDNFGPEGVIEDIYLALVDLDRNRLIWVEWFSKNGVEPYVLSTKPEVQQDFWPMLLVLH